jgi:hypothetical protein
MWWKLGVLALSAALLILVVIPIRTHAVLYDPTTGLPPQRASVRSMLANMYLTPGTVAVIVVIVGIAGFVALKVIRGHW